MAIHALAAILRSAPCVIAIAGVKARRHNAGLGLIAGQAPPLMNAGVKLDAPR